MSFEKQKSPHRGRTGKSNGPAKNAESSTGFPRNKNGILPVALRLAIIISTGFGIGYSPVAPGTLGAALGVGVYLVLLLVGASGIILLPVCCGLFLAGVYLSSIAEQAFGEKDSRRIVIDEVASFPLTMLLIPPSPTRIVMAFAFNRAADILKPFPIRRIEKLHGGWGMMLDDALAAAYANILLRLLVLAFKI